MYCLKEYSSREANDGSSNKVIEEALRGYKAADVTCF